MHVPLDRERERDVRLEHRCDMCREAGSSFAESDGRGCRDGLHATRRDSAFPRCSVKAARDDRSARRESYVPELSVGIGNRSAELPEANSNKSEVGDNDDEDNREDDA